MRKPERLVLSLLLLTLLPFSLGAREEIIQPVPPFAAVPVPSRMLEDHLNRQLCDSLPDLEKATGAVDTYFQLKYASLVDGETYDLSIVVDCRDSRGRNLYNYEIGKLQYYLKAWELIGFGIEGFSYEPEYISVRIHDHTAEVTVRPWVQFERPLFPFVVGGEEHKLTLVRTSTGWALVADCYSDPFGRSHPRGTDFAQLTRSLPDRLSQHESTAADRATVDKGENVGVWASYRTYNRVDACYYAERFALSYNDNFKPYSADCQNFASQAVWWGFGGVNVYDPYIRSHYLPMMDGHPDGPNWWADKSSTSSGWRWVNVYYFKEMAYNNYVLGRAGVHGTFGTLTVANCSCNYGDWVSQYSDSHAMIITNLPDLDGDGLIDYSEIYICGHTSNQKNVPLCWNCPSPSDAELLRIVRFQDPG